MAHDTGVLAHSYVFEHEMGAWTFGKVQALRERQTMTLRTCKVVPKSALRGHALSVVSALAVLSDVKHPHMCGITEVLEDAAFVYIISEKFSGGDLSDMLQEMIRDDQWMQEESCIAYIRQALIALVHSHALGIMHRDLRPGSLLLSDKTPSAVIKVQEIGIISILDPDALQAQAKGNPYAAPELVDDAGVTEPAGFSADVWSIGAIAHTLLINQPPSDSIRQKCLGGSNALWTNITSLLRGRRNDEDDWSDRSDESKEFVDFLLQSPEQRPTAAQALMHPWLRGSSLLPAVDEPSIEANYKLLCYMLATLLIPVRLKKQDSYMLRLAFGHVDADSDGFLTIEEAQRVLSRSSSNASPGSVCDALQCMDVTDAGVVDLCATLCADLLTRECIAKDTGAQPPTGAELVVLLLKRFFDVFGAEATTGEIRARLESSGHDLASHCDLSYDTILEYLPDDVIDRQGLISGLLESQGEGTPLGGDCHLSGSRCQPGRLDSIGWLFSGMVRTCNSDAGSRRNGRSSGGDLLGGHCETLSRRCSNEY